MSRALGVLCVGCVLVTALVGPNKALALTRDEAVDLMANRLDESQTKDGPHRGLWLPEVTFMGAITSGMASAYEWTGNEAYKVAADAAGDSILGSSVAQGNLFGDEAYALVHLSDIAADPNDNVWRITLDDFYLSPRKGHNEDTTYEYLAAFDTVEPSTSAFYIAHHAVAAHYVEDEDAKIWREALIRHLSRVDDEAAFPVMALGVATWALATIGPLDETPVGSFHDSVAYWEGVTLADLPAMLAACQVPAGESFSGSFYWRFDQGDGGTGGVVSGYTEDTVFGALGLVAVAALAEGAEAAAEFGEGIAAAENMLLAGVGEDGGVHEHLSRQGRTYNAFAGEMLQGLWSIEQYWRGQEDLESETAPPADAG